MSSTYILGSTEISSYVQELEGVDFGLPEPIVIKSGSPRTYGESFQDARWTNRTITIPLLIKGSSIADLDDKVQAILRETYSDTNTLVYTPEGGSAITFDIIKSKARLDPEAALMRRRRNLCKMTLELEAKPFGRGVETTNVAAGTLDNWTDSDDQNYLDVLSGNVSGDVPALCRLKVYDDGAYRLAHVRAGLRSTVTANYTFDLSGANSTAALDTWCGGAGYFAVVNATTQTQIASSLPTFVSANPSAYAGTHRALLRYYTSADASPVSAANTAWRFQLKYRLSSIHPWLTLPEASPNSLQEGTTFAYWVDCGTVELAELADNSNPVTGLQFVVNARNTAGITTALVDCINLIPQDEGAVYAATITNTTGDYFVISSYEGERSVITRDGIGGKKPVDWYGGPFYLMPNVNNRFYFAYANNASGFVGGGITASAKVDLTPRYLQVR